MACPPSLGSPSPLGTVSGMKATAACGLHKFSPSTRRDGNAICLSRLYSAAKFRLQNEHANCARQRDRKGFRRVRLERKECLAADRNRRFGLDSGSHGRTELAVRLIGDGEAQLHPRGHGKILAMNRTLVAETLVNRDGLDF